MGTTLDELRLHRQALQLARSEEERKHVRRMIAFFTRYTFGDEPLVVLNTFSMGAWATGLTMAIALEARGMVKATGPDLDKVLDTMVELGPGYRYPGGRLPAVPQGPAGRGHAARHGLVDLRHAGAAGWRGQLGGAARLPAAPLPHGLLRLRGDRCRDRHGSRDAGDHRPAPAGARARGRLAAPVRRADRSPMVFQYNPFFHHVTTNDQRELLYTVTRHGTLLPKVRYNPHDEGGVLRDDDLRARLATLDIRLEDLVPAGSRRLIRMPYLYVFGRKDGTVSVMGANIYPEDIADAIYTDASVAGRILSWQLSVEERPGETRPHVDIQLVRDDPDDAFRDRLAGLLTDHLRRTNRDYREAFGEYPALMPVIVDVHRRGEGPFAGTESASSSGTSPRSDV